MIMSAKKYYIEVWSYWQNAPSLFIGPFTNEDEAEGAGQCSAARPYRQHNVDLKHGVQYLVRAAGNCRLSRRPWNTLPAATQIPGDTDELSCALDRAERLSPR